MKTNITKLYLPVGWIPRLRIFLLTVSAIGLFSIPGQSQNNTNTNQGTDAGRLLHTGGGSFNCNFGYSAGHVLFAGSSNTNLGYHAGSLGYNADGNTNIGAMAGFYIVNGKWNTLVGHGAGTYCEGSGNSVFGQSAGNNIRGGNHNVVLGYAAGKAYTFSTSESVFILNNQAQMSNPLLFGTFAGNNDHFSESSAITSPAQLAVNTSNFASGSALTIGGQTTILKDASSRDDNLNMYSDGSTVNIAANGDDNGFKIRSNTGKKIFLENPTFISTTQWTQGTALTVGGDAIISGALSATSIQSTALTVGGNQILNGELYWSSLPRVMIHSIATNGIIESIQDPGGLAIRSNGGKKIWLDNSTTVSGAFSVKVDNGPSLGDNITISTDGATASIIANSDENGFLIKSSEKIVLDNNTTITGALSAASIQSTGALAVGANLSAAGVLKVTNKDTKASVWDNMQIYSTGENGIIEANGDEKGLIIRSNGENGGSGKFIQLEGATVSISQENNALQIHPGKFWPGDDSHAFISGELMAAIDMMPEKEGKISFSDNVAFTHGMVSIGALPGGNFPTGDYKFTVDGMSRLKWLYNAGDKKHGTIDARIDGTVVFGGEDEEGSNDIKDGSIAESYYSDYAVWVNGGMVANDIAIASSDKWVATHPDYVFEENYKLPSLDSVKTFIKANHHLPGIPSKAEVKERGWSLPEMDQALLKKVEELTLYIMEQDKQIRKQDHQIAELMDIVKQLVK